MSDDVVDRVAEVLNRVNNGGNSPRQVAGILRGEGLLATEEHDQVVAVKAVGEHMHQWPTEEHDRAVAARALREAANWLDALPDRPATAATIEAVHIIGELRNRATRIKAGEQP